MSGVYHRSMRLSIRRIFIVALLGVVALLLQVFVKATGEKKSDFSDGQSSDGGFVKIVHASDTIGVGVTCSGSSCTF